MIFFVFILHLFLLSNSQFTPWPEMFSFPYLTINGFSQYFDFVHAYPPMLTIILSWWYKLFGFGLWQLKVFAWMNILLCDYLLYRILKQLQLKKIIILITLLMYVLIQTFLEGNMIWFDNFLVLPVLVAFYFFLKKNVFLSGLAIAFALLTKQTAIIYLVAFVIPLLFEKQKFKKMLILWLPSVLFVGIFILVLIFFNSLNWFLNWNFVYPFLYWSKYPGYLQFSLGSRDLSLLLLLLSPSIWMVFQEKTKANLFLLLLLFSSLLAIYPRFSFFHAQVFLGLSIISLSFFFNKKIYLYILYILIILFLIWPKITLTWNVSDRFKENQNIVNVINKYLEKGEKTLLLGISSDYYLRTNSFPIKPWYDNFGWYWEIPGIQDSVIKNLSLNPPRYVFVGKNGTYYPQVVLKWIKMDYLVRETNSELEVYQFNK